MATTTRKYDPTTPWGSDPTANYLARRDGRLVTVKDGRESFDICPETGNGDLDDMRAAWWIDMDTNVTMCQRIDVRAGVKCLDSGRLGPTYSDLEQAGLVNDWDGRLDPGYADNEWEDADPPVVLYGPGC